MDIGSFKQRMQSSVNELINPLSYYEWVNKNTTLQGMPYTCDRYPFQKQIMNDMSRELACVKPSQVGLALDLNTPIPTPNGWTTMGAVQVGDKIYAADGTITTVTFKSEVYTDHKCYELEFCDGTKVVADENHRWFVKSNKAFNLEGTYPGRGRIPKHTDYVREGIITTKGIANSFKHTTASGEIKNIYAIQNTEALKGYGLVDLDPYYLGYWLGDGHSHSINLTTHKDDLKSLIHNLDVRGFACRVTKDGENTFTVKPDLKTGEKTFAKLRYLKVLKNKHIPIEYLRAPVEDRLELLRGLLDSDGSITKRGRISFYNCSEQLSSDVFELVASLGFKPRIRWKRASPTQLKNGQQINSTQPLAEISFVAYSNTPMFCLKRKLQRQNITGRVTETQQRKIVNVTEVPPRPVQCITVDHPSHLFLCTKAMIPTHNTELQLRKALAFVARNPYRNLIYTMPNEDMRKRVAQNRLIPILSNDKVFHTRNAEGKKSIRSIEITEVGTSQMLMFPANENAATSQPADVVFNDEIDLSDPQIIALFNSRLQGSDLKINQNFSTPTFEGLGISAMYDISDQHEYMFKCPHCGFYQLPDYTSQFHRIPGLPVDVAVDSLLDFDPMWVEKYRLDLNEAYSVCVKCEKPVTYGDDVNHSWVPKNPHRTVRGYKVSPFSTRSLDITYILETFLKYMALDNMKGFKNTVLGVTHESGDERLSESLLRSLFQQQHAYPNFENPSKEHPYFIGVDMGATCHITVSRAASPRKVEYVLFETVKLEKLLDRLKYLKEVFGLTGGGGIDRLPMINDSNKVRDWSHFRIMPMQYGSRKGVMVHPVDDEYGALSYLEVSRTMHLDKLAESLRNGYATFSGFNNQKDTIIKHLRAMVRILEEDKNGMEKVPVWKKKDKNDHYFHALGYNYQAILQYYEGYSYDAGQSQNSTILLFGLEENPFYQRGSHTLLGGR